jgi:hypothetical protein
MKSKPIMVTIIKGNAYPELPQGDFGYSHAHHYSYRGGKRNKGEYLCHHTVGFIYDDADEI